jgi:hypothetical protein
VSGCGFTIDPADPHSSVAATGRPATLPALLIDILLQRPVDWRALIDSRKGLVVGVGDDHLLEPFQVKDFSEEMEPSVDRFTHRSCEFFRGISALRTIAVNININMNLDYLVWRQEGSVSPVRLGLH